MRSGNLLGASFHPVDPRCTPVPAGSHIACLARRRGFTARARGLPCGGRGAGAVDNKWTVLVGTVLDKRFSELRRARGSISAADADPDAAGTRAGRARHAHVFPTIPPRVDYARKTRSDGTATSALAMIVPSSPSATASSGWHSEIGKRRLFGKRMIHPLVPESHATGDARCIGNDLHVGR
jgi:hypothetical protein